MPRLIGAEGAAGPLQAHTLAVNDAAICFLRAARERGDEFGPLAWRHEVAHRARVGRRRRARCSPTRCSPICGSTAAEVVVEQRFLELDRATLSVDRLAAELARYAALSCAPRASRASRSGALSTRSSRRSSACSPGQGGRRCGAAATPPWRCCGADPDFSGSPELSIRLCLAEDLAERGPFAPIFTDARDPEEPVDWLGNRRRGALMARSKRRTGRARGAGAGKGAGEGSRRFGSSKATASRCWQGWRPKASTRSSPIRPTGSASSTSAGTRPRSARPRRGQGTIG